MIYEFCVKLAKMGFGKFFGGKKVLFLRWARTGAGGARRVGVQGEWHRCRCGESGAGVGGRTRGWGEGGSRGGGSGSGTSKEPSTTEFVEKGDCMYKPCSPHPPQAVPLPLRGRLLVLRFRSWFCLCSAQDSSVF